jgi:hypothetical protein
LFHAERERKAILIWYHLAYCHKAKKLLEGLNAKAFVIELDNESK